MSAPSYTYALANGATADASQVMQNYNDILNGVTDGTKDLTISALTCNGAVSFKGTVALGDASSDDITVTGSLASTIPIKTTNTYDIGSSTIGLRALYFGANSQTAKIVGNAAMAGAVVVTLPPTTATLATLALIETFTNKTLTSPNVNEAVALTSTSTKLNYLTSAGGTTGTASTNIVFSTSPTLVSPTLGVAAATSISLGGGNAMDSYTEGTWTPAVAPSGTAWGASPAYTVQVGTYTRIGRAVHFQLYVQWTLSSSGTPTGNVQISGLPYTSKNTSNLFYDFPCATSQINTQGTGTRPVVTLELAPNATLFTLQSSGDAISQASVLADDNKATATTYVVICCGTYFA